LESLRRRAPVRFEIVGITVDSGYPGFRSDIISGHLREHGFEHHIEKTDHYGIIQAKRRSGSSFCSICARLKRGALYELAQKFGCNKLALGHHLDDFAETLLLNQFFVGSLKSMAASMLADNGITTVIRPLVYVTEDQIIKFAELREFPLVSCRCPVSGEADMQRRRMKRLIADLGKEIPHIRQSILRALSNVQPRHLLDRRIVLVGNEPVNGGASDAPRE
jgi:tRNA 2-thiocytidine biosynthesis protein TtcA